jgi:hypothetical protein
MPEPGGFTEGEREILLTTHSTPPPPAPGPSLRAAI